MPKITIKAQNCNLLLQQNTVKFGTDFTRVNLIAPRCNLLGLWAKKQLIFYVYKMLCQADSHNIEVHIYCDSIYLHIEDIHSLIPILRLGKVNCFQTHI